MLLDYLAKLEKGVCAVLRSPGELRLESARRKSAEQRGDDLQQQAPVSFHRSVQTIQKYGVTAAGNNTREHRMCSVCAIYYTSGLFEGYAKRFIRDTEDFGHHGALLSYTILPDLSTSVEKWPP